VRLFPDAAIVAALAALSIAIARRAASLASPSPAVMWLHVAGALAALLLAAALLYVSSGTALWLSRAHLEPHGTDRATAVSALRHRRNIGRKMPCPFPDAWYVVALSPELRAGEIVDVTLCGRSLIVFRPRDGGPPSALDAYCTHLGAHLAHGGGRLADDGCVRCPFHGWCYSKDGKLQRTETGDACPPGSDLKAWPVREQNGVVSVWMSAAGHRPKRTAPAAGAAAAPIAAADEAAGGTSDDSPWFEIPLFSELNDGPQAFVYHGCSEHVVPALIFELPENGADIGHLSALHNAFVVASLRPILSHKWAASWKADETRAHIANLRIAESMVLFGRVVLPGTVQVEITQCGPSQVFLNFNVPGIGRVFIIETVSPVAPTQQRVLHGVWAAPHVPRLVGKVLLASVVRAYEQDLPVWAHKRYEPLPRLTSSEGAIRVYRQWVKQFIRSPNAISFEEAQRAQLRVDLGLADDDALLGW